MNRQITYNCQDSWIAVSDTIFHRLPSDQALLKVKPLAPYMQAYQPKHNFKRKYKNSC